MKIHRQQDADAQDDDADEKSTHQRSRQTNLNFLAALFLRQPECE
jgi:hypothetical protein